MTTATTDRSSRLQGHHHRRTQRGGAQGARPARRRRARGRPRRGDHRVGRRARSATASRHLLDGRRRAGPPRLPGRARRRRGLPRHRLPLRRDRSAPATPSRRRCPVQPGQRDAEADGRRAGRDVRHGPVRPRPRPVLRAAQGGAARGGAGRVRRLGHRPAPRRVAHPGDHPGGRLGRAEAQGQGLPDRPLDRRRRGRATSPSTTCWSTRCSTTATRRSAAGRAPAASRRARTRAAAAGPASARPSAASTTEPLPPQPYLDERRQASAARLERRPLR